MRSGTRFDFGQQEVFALSCLGVADIPNLGEELNRLKRVHRVQAPELKSTFVRDKPKFVSDLASYIEGAGLPLMIEVVDKRFMIAANMVNTTVMPPVSDVDVTPEARWLRNIMAEYIHARAPSSVFEAYVAACDLPSAASVTKTFKEFFTWLKDEDRNDVSRAIGHSVASSFDEFKDMGPLTKEAQQRFLPPPDIGKRGQSIWMLPNLTSFTHIYARLNHLHERKIGAITLFHDEQSHFDNILHDAKRSAEELARNGAAPVMPFADYTFEEQARLIFLRSHASPGIQAADILAGFVMRHVKDSLFGTRPSDDDSLRTLHRILALSGPTEGAVINFVLGTADIKKIGIAPRS